MLLRGWRISTLFHVLVILSSCGNVTSEEQEVLATVDVPHSDESQVCPGGLVPGSDAGICVPRVDVCTNPWELPLIGGGCLPIGPRACPRAWDPDSELDCLPGELLDCRAGFVLTDDQVSCVPDFADECWEDGLALLGGGCKKIGPDWGIGGKPEFPDCEAGTVPMLEGDCAFVGPRACPKRWDQETNSECNVEELLECPGGWQITADGLACEPAYTKCPSGQLPRPAGLCETVLPAESECPSDKFPAPSGVGVPTVHVDVDSTCEENCGSVSAPFSSIQQAVDAAPEGADILIAAGDYQGFEIDKDINIRGVCAPKTRVLGVVERPASSTAPLELAGIWMEDAGNVLLSGISIHSPANGLVLVNTKYVEVSSVELAAPTGLGIYLGGGSELTAHGLWLHDTKSAFGSTLPLQSGRGIWVEGGSSLNIEDSLVEGSVSSGVYVTGMASSVNVQRTVIIGSALASTGSAAAISGRNGAAVVVLDSWLSEARGSGIVVVDAGALVERTAITEVGQAAAGSGGGIWLKGETQATVQSCFLDSNEGAGIRIHEGATGTVEACLIRGTVAGAVDGLAAGIVVDSGAALQLAASSLQSNHHIGIRAPGGSVTITGSQIAGVVPDKTGKGYGLAAWGGSQVELAYSDIADCVEAGVLVADEASLLKVRRSVVRGTMSGNTDDDIRACAIVVSWRAQAEMGEFLLEQNEEAGICISSDEASLFATRGVVRDTLPAPEGGVFGNGLVVLDSGSFVGEECVFSRNADAGVLVSGQGTSAHLIECLIEDTLEDSAGKGGGGGVAFKEATLKVERSAVENNHTSGLEAAAGGILVVSGSIVADTTINGSGGCGAGVMGSNGGVLEVTESLVRRNCGSGVAVVYSGSSGTVTDCNIIETQWAFPGEGGTGLQAAKGAHLDTISTLVARSDGMALGAWHADSTATVVDSLFVANGVDGETKPNQPGGVQADDGAYVLLDGCWLDKNRHIGIAVQGEETDVEVRQTVVSSSGSAGLMSTDGYGLLVRDHGRVVVSGAQVTGAVVAGVVLEGPGSDTRLEGTIVGDSLPAADQHGEGVIVHEGAAATLAYTLLADNATTGVVAFNEDTSVVLYKTVVERTRTGGSTFVSGGVEEKHDFGDGIFAASSAALTLEQSIVQHNARCGIFVQGTSGAADGSVITANNEYGIARFDSSNLFDTSQSWVFGNLLGDDRVAPHGFPVPSPPEVPDLPVPP